MSRFVTRPAIPLPCIVAISTPCSAAIFRTSGDDFVRTRSSKELPLLRGDAAAGAAIGFGDGAERALDSLFGGGPPLVEDDEDAAAGVAAAGAVTAGAAAATAAPFSVSSLATTVCTATVSPSLTRI